MGEKENLYEVEFSETRDDRIISGRYTAEVWADSLEDARQTCVECRPNWQIKNIKLLNV